MPNLMSETDTAASRCRPHLVMRAVEPELRVRGFDVRGPLKAAGMAGRP